MSTEIIESQILEKIEIRRVLFLVPDLQPGGSTNYLRALTAALSQNDIECLLISGSGNAKSLEAEKVSVEIIEGLFDIIGQYFAIQKAMQIAKEFSPDIIHAQHYESRKLASKIKQIVKRPVILSVHHFIDKHKKITSEECNRIIVVSESLREHLVNHVKISKDMIRVIHDGVDIKSYSVNPVRDLTKFRPIVGVAGRLVQTRGQEYFLKAAKIILDAEFDVEFVVAGEGPDFSRLKKITKDLEIENNVTFTRETPPDKVAMQLFDILVHCPLEESLGLTIIEAMAMGKPVVATGVGGIYSVVKDTETGLIVPIKNPDEIAEKVIMLMKDTELREKMSINARNLAMEEFSIEKMTEAVIKLYKTTIFDRSSGEV